MAAAVSAIWAASRRRPCPPKAVRIRSHLRCRRLRYCSWGRCTLNKKSSQKRSEQPRAREGPQRVPRQYMDVRRGTSEDTTKRSGRAVVFETASKRGAMPSSLPADGRIRVVIENVAPVVDGGRFPIKRVAGETVTVEADCFGDGHDALACRLLYRRDDERASQFVPMTLLEN